MSDILGSIVITSLDHQQFLRQTVDHLLGFPFDGWELVIVDQTAKADPGLLKLAHRQPEQVRYVHLTVRGLPNARNVGIRKARGEIIVFVDDDVVPDAGFLDGHLAPYDDPKVGGVAGRIVEAVPRLRSFSNDGNVGGVRLWDGRITKRFGAHEACAVDHVMGCNMSFRRHVLIDIAGFDRRFGGT
jgi:glycosyltransferase involved in cell wall biosynthesis